MTRNASTLIPDTRQWAERMFAQAKLGDPRRTRRLVHSAATIAQHPQKAFNQLFDWNAVRGFYNLCDRPEAHLQAIQTPHWQHTRQAMAEHPVVLILHDTTELDFTSHKALTGIGPIGGGNKGRGLLQHNSLAVVPSPRQILGLAHQQVRVRKPAPKNETSYQCQRRPDRESRLWKDGIEAIGRAAPGRCWVNVCDCGGDIYEALMAACRLGQQCLFRVGRNRKVFTTADKTEQAYLRTYARSLPSQGTDTVAIPSRGGREARTATVSLAAAKVWIPAPREYPNRQAQPIFRAWVIRVWEADPPAEVDEPLEWLLISTVPTVTVEDIRERRDWYACRWLVEDFHKIEKSGCQEESRRFETKDRMEACLAILSVVAVRVFQLRTAVESHPEEPARSVATEAEETVMRSTSPVRGSAFTVRDFVYAVAKLGGYLGRRGDGPPGIQALWRGYQRLQDMVEGYQMHQKPT